MMEALNWQFSKRAINEADIKTVESKLGFKLPEKYLEIQRKYHGARPSKKMFNTKVSKRIIIKSFLPLTEDYEVNVISVKEWLKLPDIMIPFASTPEGDYLCFDFFSPESSPAIVVWNHERGVKEYICISFTPFLNGLY